MLVHKDDPRLAHLRTQAETHNLKWEIIGPDTFAVESYSARRNPTPHKYHEVQFLDNSMFDCCCNAISVCQHIALIAAHIFPVSCGDEWYGRERREWAEKQLKSRQISFNKLLKARTEAVKREFAVRGEKSLFVEVA